MRGKVIVRELSEYERSKDSLTDIVKSLGRKKREQLTEYAEQVRQSLTGSARLLVGVRSRMLNGIFPRDDDLMEEIDAYLGPNDPAQEDAPPSE